MKIEIELQKFMLWLTGGDRSLSIDIPEEIANAIVSDDPTEQLTTVQTGLNNRKTVWYIETWEQRKLNGKTKFELLNMLTTALQESNLVKAKAIQARLQSLIE